MAGEYVLYWMQQAQRTEFNHALEHAAQQANALKLPLVVCFALTSFPEANLRHYRFMLENLQEVQARLEKRNIPFCIQPGEPEAVVPELARKASLLVTDVGYTRIQKQWRRNVAGRVSCRMEAVETDVIVPVQEVSDHEEFGARTIRSKIHRQLPLYLGPLRQVHVKQPFKGNLPAPMLIEDIDAVCKEMKLDCTVKPSSRFVGGAHAVQKRLSDFIMQFLDEYHENSSDPSLDVCSHMSPYLHFGQISPLDIALQISKSHACRAAKDAYLEQLIVRRELSMNHVWYNPQYDQFSELPAWALKTLGEHAMDRREFVYTRDQWESAATHDPYWNAAQMEMVKTGFMHNYMRMYWGKKILEWSRTHEEAFETALYLNNKYELDGRDPNGFAGVSWCFGRHDRAWTERPVFGKIRYMNANGLKRKFDIQAYVERWS
ncbi:MAG: deoxyribodipyrimidine photo-lyase [Kiritimatiellia bacterium]